MWSNIKINTISKLKGLWDDALQYMFNRRELQLKPRYELLNYLIEKYAVSRQEFNITLLVAEMYSLRFFSHPDSTQCMNKLLIYIDSFVDSGEISKTNRSGYRINGKAIVTLEKYQIDERRHKDSVKLQCLLVFLTCVLAVLAAFQAGLIKTAPLLILSL